MAADQSSCFLHRPAELELPFPWSPYVSSQSIPVPGLCDPGRSGSDRRSGRRPRQLVAGSPRFYRLRQKSLNVLPDTV